jgi:hypothetical protein
MMHTRPLRKLCELAGFAIPPEIDLYNRRLRVAITLRIMAATKFTEMKGLVRALTQAAVVVSAVGEDVSKRERQFTTHIPIDGPASPEEIERVLAILPKYCRDIPIADVVGIADLITRPDMALADIPLDAHWSPPLPAAVCGWPHYAAVVIPAVPICRATMRPYSVVTVGTRAVAWERRLREVIGEGAIFSEACFWGRFVNKYGRFPNDDDLLAFIWARYAVSGFAPTLPPLAQAIVHQSVVAFAAVVRQATPKQCAKRFMDSTSLDRRRAMEQKPDSGAE